MANDGALCRTRTITVRAVVGDQFPRIIGYELDDRPAWREPGMDDDLEPAGVLAGGSAGATTRWMMTIYPSDHEVGVL